MDAPVCQHEQRRLNLCRNMSRTQELQVNSKLEVSASPEGVKKWYEGTVEAVKYEDEKRLLEVRCTHCIEARL